MSVLSRTVQMALAARRAELAVANGSAKEKTFEEYRFGAGVVEGLRLAEAIVEQTLKQFEDDDDGRE